MLHNSTNSLIALLNTTNSLNSTISPYVVRWRSSTSLLLWHHSLCLFIHFLTWSLFVSSFPFAFFLTSDNVKRQIKNIRGPMTIMMNELIELWWRWLHWKWNTDLRDCSSSFIKKTSETVFYDSSYCNSLKWRRTNEISDITSLCTSPCRVSRCLYDLNSMLCGQGCLQWRGLAVCWMLNTRGRRHYRNHLRHHRIIIIVIIIDDLDHYLLLPSSTILLHYYHSKTSSWTKHQHVLLPVLFTVHHVLIHVHHVHGEMHREYLHM